MTVNDGKGLFDRNGMFAEIRKKLEVLADAKGVFRAGLIWDIDQMMKVLQSGINDEVDKKNEVIETLKHQISDMQKGE